MQNYTSTDVAALALELIPAAAFGLAGERVARVAGRWPRVLRIYPARALRAAIHLDFLLSSDVLLEMTAFYTALPITIAWLLDGAARADPEQRGNWRDAVVLIALGLAVDLRWLERLWPRGLAGLGKLLLVDAGLYGFVVMRQLRGTGFDFHFRWSDWKIGLREFAFFAPVVIALGLALGFLHPHPNEPRPSMLLTWVYIFVFIAVPEELFFRAWVQNLLEKRLGYWLDSRGDRCVSVGANPGALDHQHPVRTLAFQQTFDAFQLALCDSRYDCRNFLRPRLARGSAGSGLRHHSRQRGCDLVAVVLGQFQFGRD